MFELVSGVIIHSKQSSDINHAEQVNHQDTFLDLPLIEYTKRPFVSYFRGYRMLNARLPVAINSSLAVPSFPAFRVFLTTHLPTTINLVWQLESPECKSEILHVDLAKLQSKEFSVGLGIKWPVNVHLDVTKARNESCKLKNPGYHCTRFLFFFSWGMLFYLKTKTKHCYNLITQTWLLCDPKELQACQNHTTTAGWHFLARPCNTSPRFDMLWNKKPTTQRLPTNFHMRTSYRRRFCLRRQNIGTDEGT